MDADTNRIVVAVDSPDSPDVRELVRVHLSFAQLVTPAAHVHALPVDGLRDPAITLLAARRDRVLLGVGALRRLDDAHGEVKSMHTAEPARRIGVGGAILEQLLALARDRGYRRVSLETGTMPAFAAARALYAKAGFVPCAPFGEHTQSAFSVCMTLSL